MTRVAQRRIIPHVRIVGSGQTIEIFKEVGLPETVYEKFDLDEGQGHAHDRPYAHGDRKRGDDGGLASLRDRRRSLPRPQWLALQPQPPARESQARRPRVPDRERHRSGRRLYDLEAAPGRVAQGRRSRTASSDLDGFYTFCVGTADGFAVVRDPIACKHAVLAETDDWVAMATEFRAIAHLPGADKAQDLGAGAADDLQLGRSRMIELDLEKEGVRGVNSRLHALPARHQ